MKTICAVLAAAAAVAWGAVALAQSRTDTYAASSLKVASFTFSPLEGGGCILTQVCYQLDSNDGQVSAGSCVSFDESSGRLNTANTTKCNALLDVATRRAQKAARFAVDAGG